MSFLASLVMQNTINAGPNYDWADIPNCSEPRSDARNGYREFLYRYQCGICPACGEELNANDELNLCHIVSNRGNASKNRGFVRGNIYLGHRSCNMADIEFGDIVPLKSFVRADLVVTEYPDRATMMSLIEAWDYRKNADANRDAMRRMAKRKDAMYGKEIGEERG